MIVVTGAGGFIGSFLIKSLNEDNYNNVVAVDDFQDPEKLTNLDGLRILEKVDRSEFINWIPQNQRVIEFIFHLGARTDTAEFDRDLLWKLNTEYSKEVWNQCIKYQLPLIYASSAATYGLGEHGYSDDHNLIADLRPLNAYGDSKNEFDNWVLGQKSTPFFWVGLKFFNVYGPGEGQKGRMASVVKHAFGQIQATSEMKLFKSHNPDFEDGKQMRDFIYVEDVAEVMKYFMHHRDDSGIYNLGTGKARSFEDLTKAVFRAMNLPEKISFIDTPEDIRDKYQYFTEAKIEKLRSTGYSQPFHTLEEGVTKYVNYLLEED